MPEANEERLFMEVRVYVTTNGGPHGEFATGRAVMEYGDGVHFPKRVLDTEVNAGQVDEFTHKISLTYASVVKPSLTQLDDAGIPR